MYKCFSVIRSPLGRRQSKLINVSRDLVIDLRGLTQGPYEITQTTDKSQY